MADQRWNVRRDGPERRRTEGGRRVSKRQARASRKSYAVDGDDEYFDMVENGDVDSRGVIVVKTNDEKEAEQPRDAKEHQVRTKGWPSLHFSVKNML